jgi:hypothetical protein
MDMNEFNEKVKPVASETEIVFDVRSLGDRQGEALDSYLHTRAMHMNTTGIGNTPKRVVLLCGCTAEIPKSATTRLAHLNAGGQQTEIRRI